MKETKSFLLLGVVAAVLIVGVAYAAIQEIDFAITANATASPVSDNFKVVLGKPGDDGIEPTASKVGENVEVAFSASDDTKATMVVTGLEEIGDKATATFTVKNTSTYLRAELPTKSEYTVSNEKYFKVEVSDFANTVLAPDGTTTFTVSVELIRLPVTEDVDTTINLTFSASALEIDNN